MAMMEVFVLPPRESCKIRVSLLSLKFSHMGGGGVNIINFV